MINVYYVDGSYSEGFIVTGHAEYGSHGMDIVCAAVSAITQTAVLGLQEFSNVKKNVKPGYMMVEITTKNDASRIIVDTMVGGLLQIERQYPNHIQVWRKKDDART